MFYEDEYTDLDSKISKILSESQFDFESVNKLNNLLKDNPFKNRPSGSWQTIIFFPLVKNYDNAKIRRPKIDLNPYHEAFKVLIKKGGDIFGVYNYSRPLFKKSVEDNDFKLFKAIINDNPSVKSFQRHDLHMIILNKPTKAKKVMSFMQELHNTGYRLKFKDPKSEAMQVMSLVGFHMYNKKTSSFHPDTLPIMKFFHEEYGVIIPPSNVLNVFRSLAPRSIDAAFPLNDSANEVLTWAIKNCSDKDVLLKIIDEPNARSFIEKTLIKHEIKPIKNTLSKRKI